MERRQFVKACALATVASSLPALAQSNAQPKFYARARLTGLDGKPVKSRDIPANTNLIFNYPYAGTPCFLLNLGRPVKVEARLKTADAHVYEWSGGVGANDAVVAYSAICTHKLTYPTHDISFISFRSEQTPSSRFSRVIHCCSEHSQYDPARGAQVLAGPAPQPLAAILLEYDAPRDELWAVGTLGGEMFNAFFDKYSFRLKLEFRGRAHDPVTDRCTVRELSDYCRQQVKC
jgi:arsenite oxidase small subunit